MFGWTSTSLVGPTVSTPKSKRRSPARLSWYRCSRRAIFLSEYCVKERQQFVAAAARARGLYIGNKARIAKVAKTFVPLDRYPEDLKQLLEYRFFVEEPGGRYREFHLHELPDMRQRYAARIDDLATEISGILGGLANGSATKAPKGYVYIAECSSDLESARDAIARALRQRGHEILPRKPLRLVQPADFVPYIRDELSQCQLCIHPVGSYLGPIPERAGGKSLSELQLELAAGAGIGSGRLIWIPEGHEPHEKEQSELLARIRSEFPTRGFEIIERSREFLESHVWDRLQSPAAPASQQQSAAGNGQLSIYLMCDAIDRPAAESVRTYLHREGFEVHWPPATGDPARVRRHHESKLLEDDAFLIF
jgi:hypothetical protein